MKLIKKECYSVSVDDYTLAVKNETTTVKFLKNSENNLIIIFSVMMFEKDEMSEQISAVTEAFLQL